MHAKYLPVIVGILKVFKKYGFFSNSFCLLKKIYMGPWLNLGAGPLPVFKIVPGKLYNYSGKAQEAEEVGDGHEAV